MHWAAGYIGEPWEAGVSDCWCFARRVWREQFGIDVPAVLMAPAGPISARRALSGNDELGDWAEVEDPQEGDGVMMAKGKMPCHVGVWIDPNGGGILHSVEGIGAIFTPRPRLVGLGYRIVGIYRRRA